MMKKIFLTLCVLCVIVGNCFGQTTYDVFTYTEPKGYKKETKPGLITYTKTDSKAGTYCIISLYKQSPSSGNLVKDFDNDWKELVATQLGVTATPQKDNGDEITGWKTLSGGANFEFGGGTSMALLTTAKKDDANVAILIVTNAQSFLTTDVDIFFSKLKLNTPKIMATKTLPITKDSANNKNTATQVTTANNGIEGVWISYNNNGILTDRVKFKWRIFFNNGKTLLTIPDAGLHNFTNTADLDNYWGTFTYNNKKGILKYGNNAQFIDDIKFSNSDIIFIQGEEYRKCKPITVSKIVGSFSYYPNGDDRQNKPYGQSPKITFAPNGKFTDEGLFYQILKDYSKDDTYNSAGSGTYELKEYSIILKYNDGRIKQTSFTIPASKTTETADLILLGRTSLFKMK